MPPKKRALQESDTNVQTKRSSKRTKGDKANPAEQKERPDLPNYDYICINKQPYMGKPSKGKTDMVNKAAADNPKWLYTMMAESWGLLCHWNILGTYTDPDLFSMYVYNDFHPYGLLELLENLILGFDSAYGDDSLEDMWVFVSAMAHWLNHVDNDPWLCIDDGERTEQITELFGCALLTALESIDRTGELKPDSKSRDLGLVMALFLKWSIFPAEIPLENNALYWRPFLVAYAKRANIDLAKQGVDGLNEQLAQFKDEKPLDSTTSGDRWEWVRTVKEKEPRGGESHNIIRWTRKERAKAAFDEQDPLARISDNMLKEVREGKGVLTLA